MAIDLINGSPLLREWVDHPDSQAADLDQLSQIDEAVWQQETLPYLRYR